MKMKNYNLANYYADIFKQTFDAKTVENYREFFYLLESANNDIKAEKENNHSNSTASSNSNLDNSNKKISFRNKKKDKESEQGEEEKRISSFLYWRIAKFFLFGVSICGGLYFIYRYRTKLKN